MLQVSPPEYKPEPEPELAFPNETQILPMET